MTPVLAHRVDGSGESLLLLNGGMMTIASWDAIATRLAERYRLIRCDLRGQLLSPGPPPATFAGHVADVTALLDHLAVDRVHVVGTSFGAEVGVLLAATHPERVASLVAATAADCFDSSMTPGLRLLRAACRRAATAGEKLRFFEIMLPITYSKRFVAQFGEALREQAAERATNLPDEWFLAVDALLATLETLDLTPRLAQITCPTLVISAELDEIMPAARSRTLAAAVPGARHVVVEGAGHALVIERPDRFVELTLSFLRSVPDPGTRAPSSAVAGGDPEDESQTG